MLKKSQAWGFDLIAAMTIFIIGIVTFYMFSLNTYDESADIIKTLSYEGQVVSDGILSSGYPANWTEDNVVKPGILTNDKIDDSKLEQFYNLSAEDYQKSKSLLNTQDEYYFFLSVPMNISGQQVNGVGLLNATQSNLIQITRYTIYQNKPVTFSLYIWN